MKNFSLKNIQLLSDHYSKSGNPEAVALFQTIQTFYAPGQNPEERGPIDPLEVLKQLKKVSISPPENQDEALSWLNSLREKLNRELFDIISNQGNPAELILGPDYTFIQVVENLQTKPATPAEAAVPARKFKESEITFNLPDELKLEFEQQLERLKEKEEQTNIQMRESREKENAEFRLRLQKQREEEQKYNEQSQEQAEKETTHFRQELEETRKELETLRNERSNLLTKHESPRSRLDTDFSRRDQIFRATFDEMTELMEKLFAEEKTLQEHKDDKLMDNLSHYENKLTSLGKAFEELSEAFQTEKDKGQVEIIPEEDDKKPLEYDDALAKAEWPLAIRTHLGLAKASENNPHIIDYLYKFSEKWDEWIRVPQGNFLMGHPRSKDSAPHKQVQIEKPFLIKKHPVTNIEFFRFINETNYQTEAENLVDAIVYQSGSLALKGAGNHSTQTSFSNPSLGPAKDAFWLCPDGQPDSLYGKYNHPVTQVTWNDAQAYCKWKSELTGQTIRLPSEKEWEYVAGNFGKRSPDQFYWDEDRIVEFCNIEETGVLDTLPVDHFPENEYAGGTYDLFGNVFEWVQDTHDKKLSNGSSDGLEYKIARGGSFITHFKHIAAWRRISFLKTYCTSFLGFRTICNDV